MAISLVRFLQADVSRWGVVRGDQLSPIAADGFDTARVLEIEPQVLRKAPVEADVPLAKVQLLSPITAPCRILCQGANYRQHMIESGLDPDAKHYDLIFAKSDCALTAARGTVQRPAHVKLLDYELELGLVIGCKVDAAVAISARELPHYVKAVVMANDLSARDVQIPQLQWFKGKSYRAFCPVGPYLCVLEPDDYARLAALELSLTVNGELRQRDSTRNLVFKPHEALAEISHCSSLAPGDLVLTGTPAGCALRAPSKLLRVLAELLPEPLKWRLFIASQQKRREYLQRGDVIRSRIRSADGALDLGEQELTVAAP